MKNLKLLFIAAGFMALGSCSGDDDNDNDVNNNLVGTYELTMARGDVAQDYDGDGDTSTDLVTEGECYNSSWISFKADGTYKQSMTHSVSSNNGLELTCETQVSTGTYSQNGQTVVTTRTSGEGDLTATYIFDASAHTLKRGATNVGYYGWNETTSLWSQMIGNFNITFTKYSNDADINGSGQDDDDNISASGMDEIHGTFNQTSFKVATAADLDNDNDSSTNLVDETSCYGDSYLIFHEDGTYEEKYASSELTNASGTSLTCNTLNTTGVWSRSGNHVITRKGTGLDMVSHSYTYNGTTHTLTRSEANGTYPTFNAGIYSITSGNIDYTFTK